MALNLIPLVLDLYDGGLNLISSGSATLVPSSQLNDVVDQFGVLLSPLTVGFHPDASPMIQIVPTDNENIQPSGWAWQITFNDVTGAPEPYYFNIAGSGTVFSFTATGPTFTAAGSSFSNGTGVVLTGSSLPGGFWPGTIYYVVGAAGAAFSLAASPGGSAIASTSTGSGEVTVVQYLSSLVSTLDVATVIPLSVAAGGTGSTSQNWQGLLTPVTVTQSSGSYAATAGALVKASISGGSWTVNLPNAPANNTVVGAKVMANAVGNANTLTVACQGSDVFEQSGGSTSVTMSLPLQAAQWQYNSGYWTRISDDLPLGQLDNRYQKVFSPLTYGAAGNGTTDDTTAIAAALSAASGGGTVYFPPGTYLVSAPLQITSGITIQGAGATVSVMKGSASFPYSSQGGVFQFGSGTYTTSGPTLTGCRIADIGFSMTAVNDGTRNQVNAIFQDYCCLQDLRIERIWYSGQENGDCIMLNGLGRGQVAQWARGITIRDVYTLNGGGSVCCYFNANDTGSKLSGIEIGNIYSYVSADVEDDRVVISANFPGGSSGNYAYLRDVTIRDIFVDVASGSSGTVNGVKLDTGAYGQIQNVLISGVHYYALASGGAVGSPVIMYSSGAGAATGYLQDYTVENVYAQNSYGVELFLNRFTTAPQVTVRNVVMENCRDPLYLVSLQTQSTAVGDEIVTFDGVSGNSVTSAGTYVPMGIQLWSGSSAKGASGAVLARGLLFTGVTYGITSTVNGSGNGTATTAYSNIVVRDSNLSGAATPAGLANTYTIRSVAGAADYPADAGAGVTVVVPAPTGATATDTPNVTSAVTSLTTALGSGPATLQFADGTYQVDSNSLVIRSCSNFAVRGTGATVIAQAPNRTAVPNNTAGNIFTIADCSDFTVSGITLDGLRDTLAPITPLTASASSGQPSVTVASGQGTRYTVGETISVCGGLGASDASQYDANHAISSITAGGGSGGGDLITFTGNLSHSYSQISSTLVSDPFGPYACEGDYLIPYQTGSATVAGRSLSGQDQQNALHLINCTRFAVTNVEARNVWESPVRLGTYATSLTDGCTDGLVSGCRCYHGYNQGIAVWISQNITVEGNVVNNGGWAGVSCTASDYCTVTGNQLLNSAYQFPITQNAGSGVVTEGGQGNQFTGNIIENVYAVGIQYSVSPLGWGLTTSTSPTTSTYLTAGTAAGTSIQVSSTAHLETGGWYSVVDGSRTEAVTVASIVDSTHVTFSGALQFSHASGSTLTFRVPAGNVAEGNTVNGTVNGAGIWAALGARNIIKNNTVISAGNSPGAYGPGILLSASSLELPSGLYMGAQGSIIDGNIVGGCSGQAIIADEVSNLTITGNRCYGGTGNYPVIDFKGITDSVLSGNYVSDNEYNCGIKIEVGTISADQDSARLVVTGNTVRRTNNEGIIALNADSLTITGNLVTSCGGNAGIDLRGVTNSAVADNICNANSNAGIQLENNSSAYCLSNRVSGNTCRDDGSGIKVSNGNAQTQQYGINETGASNYNLIYGNECDSNATAQIATVGAQTCAWANVISGVLAGGSAPPQADYAASGLTGATAASRYVGATTSGHPASGTFAVGDFSVDQTGMFWICTTAGTPGTWAEVAYGGGGGGGGSVDSVTAGDSSVVIGGSLANPTVAAAYGRFLCAPVSYAPGTQTTYNPDSTTLTAFSSANINTGSFTAPPSQAVVVTVSFTGYFGTGTSDYVAFGLLSHGGSTVYGNLTEFLDSSAGLVRAYTLTFPVTSGLTSGSSYSFDFACAVTSGDTFYLYAFGQSTTTPVLGSTGKGGPVVMTVQAV